MKTTKGPIIIEACTTNYVRNNRYYIASHVLLALLLSTWLGLGMRLGTVLFALFMIRCNAQQQLIEEKVIWYQLELKLVPDNLLFIFMQKPAEKPLKAINYWAVMMGIMFLRINWTHIHVQSTHTQSIKELVIFTPFLFLQ